MSTNILISRFSQVKQLFQPQNLPKWHLIIQKSYSKSQLQAIYENTKKICYSKKPPRSVNPRAVFACNELHLDEISVYGFDYDFTLACYKPAMDFLLYNLGRDVLVNRYMYPKEILKLEYQPDFAIRGLHYDIEKGLLMKLDSFLQIQLGTVYRGLTPVPKHAVIQLYKNKTIPHAYVEGSAKFGEYPGYLLQNLSRDSRVDSICMIYFQLMKCKKNRK